MILVKYLYPSKKQKIINYAIIFLIKKLYILSSTLLEDVRKIYAIRFSMWSGKQ